MDQVAVAESVRRIVVLGDPHGDIAAVEEVYRIEDGPDALFCCVGDVVGYADGHASSRLCRFLMEKQTLTVEGNHEDWVSPKGKLAIVHGNESQLTEEALGWVKRLPTSVRLTRNGGEPLAVLTHSIRHGGWDWVDEQNAPTLVKGLGAPPVVLAGHSHRPKFITVSPEGVASRHSYDYRTLASLGMNVPDQGTLIVDAGSLARPEATEVGGTASRHDGDHYGTYAVLELSKSSTALASLKRISKRAEERVNPL